MGYIRAHTKAVLSVLGILALLLGGSALYVNQPKGPPPTNFEECSKMYRVSGELPRTCQAGLFGRTFVEYEATIAALNGEIQVELPPAPVISSPLELRGMAAPDWYSQDGTLDVKLLAGAGKVIASAKAQRSTDPAQPVTPGYNVFSTELSFSAQNPDTMGAIVISKNNSTTTLVLPVGF